MKIIKSLLLGYASYEMWKVPSDVWHRIALVIGAIALITLYEAIIKSRYKFNIERKEK